MESFKKFIKLRESSDIAPLVLSAEANPEEDTAFLVAADALEESGYNAIPKYIRTVFSPNIFTGQKNNKSLARIGAVLELKDKANENGLELNDMLNQLSFIFPKQIDPKTFSKEFPYVSIRIIYSNFKIKYFSVKSDSMKFMGSSMSSFSREDNYNEIKEILTPEQQMLFSAACLYLITIKHGGVESNKRIMSELEDAVDRLNDLHGGRFNPDRLYELSQRIGQVVNAYNSIKSFAPDRSRYAARIIFEGLYKGNFRRCISTSPARPAPNYCTHFQTIRNILTTGSP